MFFSGQEHNTVFKREVQQICQLSSTLNFWYSCLHGDQCFSRLSRSKTCIIESLESKWKRSTGPIQVARYPMCTFQLQRLHNKTQNSKWKHHNGFHPECKTPIKITSNLLGRSLLASYLKLTYGQSIEYHEIWTIPKLGRSEIRMVLLLLNQEGTYEINLQREKNLICIKEQEKKTY